MDDITLTSQPSVPPTTPGKKLFQVGLVFLVFIGLLLRWRYWRLPLGIDEAYTYLSYARGSLLTALGKYNLPNNHILNSLLIHASRQLFGETFLALRLPAFCFGVATVAAAGWVWRQLSKSFAIGLAAAAFTAVSSKMIHFSVEARGYSLQAFFFLIALYAADRVLTKPSRLWILIFAIVSTLGLLAVPTHLYGIAAICLWMTLCSFISPEVDDRKKAFIVVVQAHLSLLSLAWTCYALALIYVLINGTKIEPAEALSHLPSILFLRWNELKTDWIQAHSILTAFWVAIGGVLLCLFGLPKRSKESLLFVSLIAGPILIFILTHRVAPFTRVWTFLLPSFFALAACGWKSAVAPLGLNRDSPMVQSVFALLLAVPLLASLAAGFKQLSGDLKPSVSSAEHCWDSVASHLQPGDHFAVNSEFFPKLQFIGLTHPEVNFAPVMRATDGNLAVLEQNGSSVAKYNPFDPSKPGRTVLYALQPSDVAAMEEWLTPFLPTVTPSSATAPHLKRRVANVPGMEPGEYPMVYEFAVEP